TTKGSIGDIRVVAEVENPTYLCISNDQDALYSVAKKGTLGGVASYAINHADSALEFINMQVTEGPSPCHISVDEHEKHVVVANYHRGSIEAHPVHNRAVQPVTSVVLHEGSGPNTERQEKPHVHFAGFTPDQKYVVAVDLGTDTLETFKLTNYTLTKVQSLSLAPGCGPRHLAFHPNGKYAYIITELSNEIIVLTYNPADGSFHEIQYNTAVPLDYRFKSQAGAIHVSADGRYVYASIRGHNSIAVFKVDEKTGKLTLVEHTPTEGLWPRDFSLDPSEEFLVVANQESNNLALFERDKATGKLSLLQSNVAVPSPVCVKFLNKQ
ncbi:MAG: lactonase family protein, partial [Bacillus sp. (in: firmicutes)]